MASILGLLFFFPLLVAGYQFDARISCRLAGSVINLATRAPIAQAKVELRPVQAGRAASTSTDAAGKFCFTETAPGRYLLHAGGEGYVEGVYGARSANQSGAVVSVLGGATSETFTILLAPESSVAGSVEDEHGTRLANASVRMYQMLPSRRGKQLIPVWIGTSDAKGEFLATALSPGPYYLGAHARPSQNQAPQQAPGSTDEVYAMSFYPRAQDVNAAIPIIVTAGQNIHGAKVTLKRLPGVTVRGQVIVSVTGAHAGAAMVSLSPKGFAPAAGFNETTVRTDSSGAFSITGVVPGSYTLSATLKSGNSVQAGAQELEIGKYGMEGVRVTLLPQANVPGMLSVDGRNDVPRDKIHIYFTSRDTGKLRASAVTDADGKFMLTNVPAGEYQVAIAGLEDDLYVKSISVGSNDVLTNGLSLTGSSPGMLEVVVSAKGAEVSGVVTDSDDRPTQGLVLLVPDTNEQKVAIASPKTASADQAGGFRVRGLAPGNYAVIAVQDSDPENVKDPEFIRGVRHGAVRVRVAEQDRVAVQVRLVASN